MFRHEVESVFRSRLFVICVIAVAVFSALGGLVFTGVGLAMIDAGEGVGFDQLVRAAVVKGSAAPVVAGVLGAVSIGRLFRHGGLSTSLWLMPRRGRLFATLLGAVSLAGAVLGLIGVLSVAGVSLAVGDAAGTPPSAGLLGFLALAQTLICALTAAMGGSVAILLRSQVGAMAAMLLSPLILEPMVRGMTANLVLGGPVAHYLPVALMERVQIDAANPVVPVSAAAPSAMVAAVALGAMVALFLSAAHGRLARIDA